MPKSKQPKYIIDQINPFHITTAPSQPCFRQRNKKLKQTTKQKIKMKILQNKQKVFKCKIFHPFPFICFPMWRRHRFQAYSLSNRVACRWEDELKKEKKLQKISSQGQRCARWKAVLADFALSPPTCHLRCPHDACVNTYMLYFRKFTPGPMELYKKTRSRSMLFFNCPYFHYVVLKW